MLHHWGTGGSWKPTPLTPWTLRSKFEFSVAQLLPLFISYSRSGEKLIKYQSNSSCVIMSVILMTTLFYKALILQGEIWCWSLLGLKGLNRPVPIYLNSYLAPRLGGTKQKKCIIHCWVSRWFLLFYSHKPRSQVWIWSYQNWSVTVEPHITKGQGSGKICSLYRGFVIQWNFYITKSSV